MTQERARFGGRVVAPFVSFPRRRRIRAPEWLQTTSYAKLLHAERPSILWLHEPKALPPSTDLLLPELANEEIREHHSRIEPSPSGIGIASLPNALVSGHSLVGTRSTLYLMAPITPLFVDQFLQDNSKLVGDRRLSKKAKRFVPGTSILLTNWNSCNYGHWLLEGMPKLLLLARIADQLPPLRVVLPRSLPMWVTRWIELLLPQAALERYDDATEYVQCETLLMPTLLSSPEHYPHPELAALLEGTQRFSRPPADPCTQVFVSRASPNAFREMINLAEIEQIAQEHGLKLIRPETLPIPEQIAHFANAQLIVGEFGSAMHNALFSPRGTRLLCLNWMNALQSHIARLKRQHVGYLLPSSGIPATYALDQPRVGYHIDPHVFRSCLKRLGLR